MIKNPIEEKRFQPSCRPSLEKFLYNLPREPCDDDGDESFITPLSGIIFVMEGLKKREKIFAVQCSTMY